RASVSRGVAAATQRGEKHQPHVLQQRLARGARCFSLIHNPPPRKSACLSTDDSVMLTMWTRGRWNAGASEKFSTKAQRGGRDVDAGNSCGGAVGGSAGGLAV